MKLLKFRYSSSIADFVSFPYRPRPLDGVDISDPSYRGKQSEADVAISETKPAGKKADPQRTAQKSSYLDSSGSEKLIRPIDRVRAVRKSIGRSKLMGENQPAFDSAIDTLRSNREVTNKVAQLDRYFRQEAGNLKPWEQEAYSRHTSSNGSSGLSPITAEQAAQLQADLKQPKNQKAVQNVQDAYRAVSTATEKPTQILSYPVKGLKPALTKEVSRKEKWERLTPQQQEVNRKGAPEQVPSYKQLDPVYADKKKAFSPDPLMDEKGRRISLDAAYKPTKPKGASRKARERLSSLDKLTSSLLPVQSLHRIPKSSDPIAPKELIDRVSGLDTSPIKSEKPNKQPTPKTKSLLLSNTSTPSSSSEHKTSYEMMKLRQEDKSEKAKKARRFFGKVGLGVAGTGAVLGGGYLLKKGWDRYQENKEFEEYKLSRGYK
ncbi:hypothetical protein [Chroococcidiopsis sp.]|uniref:hypothetical protein n=1 Tax=Chroococcidiopsis sp. TaxID=3088168 RepID=UPI003F2AD928